MTDKRWKRNERVVAKALGRKRNPNTGEHRTDIDAPAWGIEHKTRKAAPAWFTGAMAQSRASVAPGQRPVVIFTVVSQGRKAERFVLLRLEDALETLTGLRARDMVEGKEE